ncbi:MAG: hypothetical protein H8E78_10100, partial [Proteobacteria bacterium]|nr:hypothetical protein [Pseudomonadota bacterium]
MAIELDLDESDKVLCVRSAQTVGISEAEVRGMRIARRALDARRRGRSHVLRFVVHVDLDLDEDFRSDALDRALKSGRAQRVLPPARFELDDYLRLLLPRRVFLFCSV